MARYFFILLLLIGCGKKFDTIHDAEPLFTKTQDIGAFLKETKAFYALENLKIKEYATVNKITANLKSEHIEADSILRRIPINFYNLKTLYKEDFAAVCRKSTKTGRKEILVDPVKWKPYNENIRTALIVHELGHCELNRLHTLESCKSVMTWILISNFSLRLDFATELFDSAKYCPNDPKH